MGGGWWVPRLAQNRPSQSSTWILQLLQAFPLKPSASLGACPPPPPPPHRPQMHKLRSRKDGGSSQGPGSRALPSQSAFCHRCPTPWNPSVAFLPALIPGLEEPSLQFFKTETTQFLPFLLAYQSPPGNLRSQPRRQVSRPFSVSPAPFRAAWRGVAGDCLGMHDTEVAVGQTGSTQQEWPSSVFILHPQSTQSSHR